MRHSEPTYKIYDRYIIRTPKYAVNDLQSILQQGKGQVLQNLCNDLIFLEAIYLASPSLYNAVRRYLENKISPKESNKLLYSLVKYYSRMSTRCTPFGLFAGTAIGKFQEISLLIVDSRKDRRHTRMDMHYLYQLAKAVEVRPDILPHLFLYPNNSIYQFGKQLRYIHYTYQNNIRKYGIMSTDTSYVLNLILRTAHHGASFTQLQELLNQKGFLNVENYLKDLIDSQILYSELEPSVTGQDFLSQMISTLQSRVPRHSLINNLRILQKEISNIDVSHIGDTIHQHEEIIQIIQQIENPQTLQYLFQTDLSKHFSSNTLSAEIKKKLARIFRILNKVTVPQNRSGPLQTFISLFKSRYEAQEISLSKLLDTEIGLLYKMNEYNNNNLLLQYIILPQQKETVKFSYTNFQILLQKRLQICLQKNEMEIVFTEDELVEGADTSNALPKTLSCMCNLFYEKNQLKIFARGATGPSCIDLIARFAYTDPEIDNFVHEIARKEDELYAPAILADILHVPEARIGNVMLRPSIRKYEIPYLTKSNLEFARQIYTSDILVSIKEDRFFLRSVKLNKQIIPRLSNAYNYHQNALPLYRFLCDMQDQNKKPFIKFEWGYLEQKATFLPRVSIDYIILSLAQWNLTRADVSDILESGHSEQILMQSISLLRAKFNIPRYVTLKEQDNELLIDFDNDISINIFFAEIKNKTKFTLIEYPYTTNSYVVKDDLGKSYTSQFIFSAYQLK